MTRALACDGRSFEIRRPDQNIGDCAGSGLTSRWIFEEGEFRSLSLGRRGVENPRCLRMIGAVLKSRRHRAGLSWGRRRRDHVPPRQARGEPLVFQGIMHCFHT